MPRSKRADFAARTESELVRLAQAGDHAAFRVIMERGNQRLFRVARGIVRDDNEAEDVLQEAYVRAFAAIDAFRNEAAIMTWLTRIVLNEARGRLRKQRPTVELELVETAQVGGGEVIPFPTLSPASGPDVMPPSRRFAG